MNKQVGLSLVWLAISALVLPHAQAEVLLLKSGGRVEGELLNPSRATGEHYRLRTAPGVTVSLAPDQVTRVIVKSDVQKQYEQLLPRVPHDADGHWKMAQWCREAGLMEERKVHLAEVLKHDPEHADARLALGYSKFGDVWMTAEEYMRGQGYVRYKGAWRLEQDIALQEREVARELAEKDWKRKLKIWFDQLDRKRADEALANIRGIRDPLAAPALADVLGDMDADRNLRLLCLEVLAKLPAGLATRTHIQLSMDETDGNIRDKCLDELRRGGAQQAIPVYLKALENKKSNSIVNRAAVCLERLGDPDVTLPLIDALVTEHQVTISPASSGGGGLPINFGAGGSGSGNSGGLGGLSMGGKPKVEKRKFKNAAVHAALTQLNPGINFLYDQDAWKNWYANTKTSTNVDLRRGE